MPFSVRLDPATESRVRRLSREAAQTKSQVVREAIAVYDAQRSGRSGTRTPYERIKHLIGSAKGGPPDLSQATGEKLTALLREAIRAGHSR